MGPVVRVRSISCHSPWSYSGLHIDQAQGLLEAVANIYNTLDAIAMLMPQMASAKECSVLIGKAELSIPSTSPQSSFRIMMLLYTAMGTLNDIFASRSYLFHLELKGFGRGTRHHFPLSSVVLLHECAATQSKHPPKPIWYLTPKAIYTYGYVLPCEYRLQLRHI